MCGIVGYIGRHNATPVLVEGLRRLEYRGYDSAGIAVLNGKGVEVRRSVGKLPALESLLDHKPIVGTLGLGHTRWATHGRPCEANAHPHTCCNNKITVVHNGIIENYAELKSRLSKAGHRFKSETDTEILAHLIEDTYAAEHDLGAAVRLALHQAKGSYALGVLSADDRTHLIAARKDSPIVVGLGKNETFLASDVPAFLPFTRQVIFLEDGEIAELTADQVRVFDLDGKPIERKPQTVTWDALMAEKGGYKHFMLKEIFEQGRTVQETFRGRISLEKGRILLDDILPPPTAGNISRVCLLGCGTSYHAALVGRFWMQELAGLPCDAEIASEYRYRRNHSEPGTLIVAISQSGETADTLAALREAKREGLVTLALCNAVGSTATREATSTMYTFCGPEIGVASTKAFTGQLTALFLLALYLAQNRRTAETQPLGPLLEALSQLPHSIRQILGRSVDIDRAARRIAGATHALYLGRHLNYPVALEGALKMKEITYMHAEGYPAGEMKHGPIALIDEELPVIALATASSVRDKVLSNIEEVKARGALVIALVTDGDEEVRQKANLVLSVPKVHEYLAPILNVIPLQWLAYQVAVLRGRDVDQPRNLAKSVTVE